MNSIPEMKTAFEELLAGVLDLAGDTGGYNLQAAFSTGWLAGLSASRVDISASMVS